MTFTMIQQFLRIVRQNCTPQTELSDDFFASRDTLSGKLVIGRLT